MKKTKWVLVLSLTFAAAATFWSLNHHVIRTNKGTVVLHKRFITSQYTFVDTRKWTYEDFRSHDEVKTVLEQNGYRDYLTNVRIADIRRSVHETRQRIAARWNRACQDVANALNDSITWVQAWFDGRPNA